MARTRAAQAVNVDRSVSLSVMSGAMTSGGMSMTGGPGMALTAQASATNLLDPVYQFWVENPSGQ